MKQRRRLNQSQNVAFPLTDKKNRTVDQVSIIEDIMEQRRTPDMYLIITNISNPRISKAPSICGSHWLPSVLVVKVKRHSTWIPTI
jgi:hypothetical protein